MCEVAMNREFAGLLLEYAENYFGKERKVRCGMDLKVRYINVEGEWFTTEGSKWELHFLEEGRLVVRFDKIQDVRRFVEFARVKSKFLDLREKIAIDMRGDAKLKECYYVCEEIYKAWERALEGMGLPLGRLITEGERSC